MRRGPSGLKRSLRFVLICGAIGFTGAACAQEADPSNHPVDAALEKLNLKREQGAVPDFVRASRPKKETGYIPVGVQHPTRDTKVKSPAELKAAIADLDAARIHQDKITGRKQPDEIAAKPARKPPAAAPTAKN